MDPKELCRERCRKRCRTSTQPRLQEERSKRSTGFPTRFRTRVGKPVPRSLRPLAFLYKLEVIGPVLPVGQHFSVHFRSRRLEIAAIS